MYFATKGMLHGLLAAMASHFVPGIWLAESAAVYMIVAISSVFLQSVLACLPLSRWADQS